MTRWTDEDRAAFTEALERAYPTAAELRHLLRTAGVPVVLLPRAGHERPTWQEAVALAERRDALAALQAAAASYHPEVQAFTMPLDRMAEADRTVAQSGPANIVRKLGNVLRHNFNPRDRTRLLRLVAGPEAAALSDAPEEAAVAVARAGALRALWTQVQQERPQVLPLPYPDDAREN